MASTLSELAALVGGEVEGDGTVGIEAVASAASAGAGSLVFAENDAALKDAVASAAGALLVSKKAGDLGGKPAIRADNPRIAFVRIATRLNPEPRPAPGIHPSAAVHASATVGTGVHVGAWATVGAGAVLGDGAIVGPGCHVGDGARIGAGTRLHPNVVLYAGVTLGDRVLVHAGAVLGADGFGFVDTPQGRVKFPQLGTLVVGNDVEIGANTTIDRGALDATKIGDGTKIDNQVQIAHNCEIGRYCAISAHTGIAGTSKLGDRVVCGGKVGIADHATIGDGAILGAGTGIPTGKVLPGGQVYWGVPVKPIAEAKRLLLAPARIERLLTRVADLEERVSELEA